MSDKCKCGLHTDCDCQAKLSGIVTYPLSYPFRLLPDINGDDTNDVMSPGRMDKLMREFFEHLMKKSQRKNKAYAETDTTSDALNNFREAAAEFDISKLTYAMILQGKHYRAWKTFVRTGKAPDKAFRILGDIIVYAFLMYCIGIDEGKWKHEQEVLEDDD